MSFTMELGSFAAQATGDVDETIRDVVLEVGARIVARSPVDTGRFRSNWFVSRGGPMSGVTERNAGVLNGTEQVPSRGVAGAVYYIQNNLPYAWRLEMGHSDQAPMGMVGITVAEFSAIVDNAGRGASNER